MFPPDPGTTLGYWSHMAAHRYFDLLLAQMQGSGLDRGFYALMLIAEHDGYLSQQELAERLHVDKATMVRTLDLLSEKGYVERSTCPSDRRKHRLKLLPAGKPVVTAIRASCKALNSLAFAGVAAEEQARFLETLSTVLNNLAAADGTPRPVNLLKKRSE